MVATSAGVPAKLMDPQPPASPSRHVDVWIAELSNSLWSCPDRRAILSDDEKGRAERFRFPRHRKRFEAAHLALRVILSRYLQCDPAMVSFETGRHGKPRIAGVPTDVFFNLSHSEGTAVVAVSRGADVGVDIECVRHRRPDVAKIAERFFSAAELSILLSAPMAERHGMFLRCWTRKEALLKACGRGLSVPLASCNVDPCSDTACHHQIVDVDGALARWTIVDLQTDERVTGALAVQCDHGSSVAASPISVTVARAERVLASGADGYITSGPRRTGYRGSDALESPSPIHGQHRTRPS
jgi:4'-phosphopantetheinyl transferase